MGDNLATPMARYYYKAEQATFKKCDKMLCYFYIQITVGSNNNE